jgi:hypothetical protein
LITSIQGGKAMKKVIVLSLAICFLAVASNSPVFPGWDPGKAKQERKAAEATIAKFKAKDPSIKRFFDSAYGYAVFPTVGKGAFIVGAAQGSGPVYEKGKIVGRAKLGQVRTSSRRPGLQRDHILPGQSCTQQFQE